MKKKTLIFIEDGSFTYDNRVVREANALVEAGWEVTVISPKYSDDPFYKKLNDKLRAYYYPKPNAKGEIGHIVEHSFSIFFGSLLTLWVFLRHGFSIFQACNPMDIGWMISLPYNVFGRKFIFDQHDICPELYLSRGGGSDSDLPYKLLKFLEKKSYQFSDAVIATNESYKEIAVTRGGKTPEEVFVVRNGPDLNKFRKVSPRNGFKKDGETLVGYLGNMNIQDGVDYLLRAAEDIHHKHGRKDIKYVLIGGGSHRHVLMEMAKKMGLDDIVTFTGRVPDDEMLETLSACDICVQPDPFNPLNDKSTMNKVMEYMAIEKPVVAFELKETKVTCGNTALYATRNVTSDLCEKIIFLADNPEVRIKMGRAGRERVEKYFSWEFSIPHLISAYEYVIRSF